MMPRFAPSTTATTKDTTHNHDMRPSFRMRRGLPILLSTPAGTVRRETSSLPWLAAPWGQGRFRRALGARTPGALRSKPMVLSRCQKIT
jgi:hypothetical protein